MSTVCTGIKSKIRRVFVSGSFILDVLGLVVILSDADIHDLQHMVVSQCDSRSCCGVIND